MLGSYVYCNSFLFRLFESAWLKDKLSSLIKISTNTLANVLQKGSKL